MLLDVERVGMNASVVNLWNPHDILDAGRNVSFRFGLVILNQPINIQRDLMLSLWGRGKCEFCIFSLNFHKLRCWC
jgi:hypothetical protein